MKNHQKTAIVFLCLLLAAIFFLPASLYAAPSTGRYIKDKTIAETIEALCDKTDKSRHHQVRKGVRQVADLWRADDGDQEAFSQFCRTYFIDDMQVLAQCLKRYDSNLESIGGNLKEIALHLNTPLDTESGSILPVDYLFGRFSPFAHVNDDLFKTRIAFVALLNFPLYTLAEKNSQGLYWSREQWAGTRLAERFSRRVPAAVAQELTRAKKDAKNYIYSYKFHMGNILTPEGVKPFPEDLRLSSHWGLRDELKGCYTEKDSLARQQFLVTIMERIIRGEVPKAVINNPRLKWDPILNKLYSSQGEIRAEPEGNARYGHLLANFQAARLEDPYVPGYPTQLKRSFEGKMEISEEELEAYLTEVLTAPQLKDTARLIEKRLGRKLKPFDIWYTGFYSQAGPDISTLNRIVADRYKTAVDFQRDIPRILTGLGFSKEKAAFLAERILVEPSRGAGHASSAYMKGRPARLRTPFQPGGMNYEGFQTSAHELGHSVEQVFSLECIDYVLLRGVPNTAFTEGFAFLFELRDLEMLGLKGENPGAEHLQVLNTLWNTYEIAGVALLDLKVWRWMYEHPDASPEELKEAVILLATEIWNRYYAPVIGESDSPLLAIYSHMIYRKIYIPNYPVGHIIQFQIEDYMNDKDLAREMERMCTQGSISPSVWLKNAVGHSISPRPLLEAGSRALKALAEE